MIIVMLLAGYRGRVAAVSGEKPPQEPDGRTVFMGGWNQFCTVLFADGDGALIS